MKTGEIIKKLRKEQMITQVQLAQKSGLHEATIRKYEQCLIESRLKSLQKIAEALGVDRENLIGSEYVDYQSFHIRTIESDLGYKAALMLQKFVLLNEQGQDKAISYLTDLLLSDHYKRKDDKG